MASADVDEQKAAPRMTLSPSEKFFRYFQQEVTGLSCLPILSLQADCSQICKARWNASKTTAHQEEKVQMQSTTVSLPSPGCPPKFKMHLRTSPLTISEHTEMPSKASTQGCNKSDPPLRLDQSSHSSLVRYSRPRKTNRPSASMMPWTSLARDGVKWSIPDHRMYLALPPHL